MTARHGAPRRAHSHAVPTTPVAMTPLAMTTWRPGFDVAA
jgi:hypothetical protein